MAGKQERPNRFQRSQCDNSDNCELVIPPYVSIRSTSCATGIPIIGQEEEIIVDACARVDAKLHTTEQRIFWQNTGNNILFRDPKYSESVFIGHDELCSRDLCGNFDRMQIGGRLNSRRMVDHEVLEANGEGRVCENICKMHGNFQCECICKNHGCRPCEVERVEKTAAPSQSSASLDFMNVPAMHGQNACLKNSLPSHRNIHEDRTVLRNSMCPRCYVNTIDKYNPAHWEQCLCKDCASRVFTLSDASCAPSVTNANVENKTHLYVDCLSSNAISGNDDPASKHPVPKTRYTGCGQSPPALSENRTSTYSTNCVHFKKLDSILLQKACSQPVNRLNVQVARSIPSMSSAISNEDKRNFPRYSKAALCSNLSHQPEHRGDDDPSPVNIVNVPLDDKETQVMLCNVDCSAVSGSIPEISKSAESHFEIKNDHHHHHHQVQCKRSSDFVVNFEVVQSPDHFAGTCHELGFHANREHKPKFDHCWSSEVNSAFYTNCHNISKPTEEHSVECSVLKGINSNKNRFNESANHLSKEINLSDNLEQVNTRKLPPPYYENPGGTTAVHSQTHDQTSDQFHQNLLLAAGSYKCTDPTSENTKDDFSSDTSTDEESNKLPVSDTSLPRPERKQMISLKKERVRYYPAYFKLYMEQHIENVLKSYHQRLKRRQQLEEEMETLNLPEIDRKQCRSWLFQKESQYNRLKRTQMSLSHFETITILGRGAFGDVSLIRRRDSGVLYAMKTLKKKDVLRQKQIGHVKAERDLLAETDSEWVVKLYYSFQDSQSLYFVMEYVAGGDLMGLLVKMKIFTHRMARFYTAELVLAIESVHRLGYIHRDIKPDNVLIGLDGHVKLTDFGLCTGFHRTHASESYALEKSEESNCEQKPQNRRSTARSLVGTPNYIAPEVLLQSGDSPEFQMLNATVC